MAITRVSLGSTPTIVSYPRVAQGGTPLLGRVSDVTVRIGTPASALPSEDDWQSATVDPVDTVTVAAAAEGADTVYVVDGLTPWIRGRRYVIENTAGDPDGDISVVTASATRTSETLNLISPLTRSVPSGVDVYGIAVTKDLTAEQTAVVGPGIAIWRATVDGVEVSWSSSFRIVRRMPTIPLVASELAVAYPQILRMRDVSDETLEELIATAWEHRVLPRLSAKGVIDEDIVDSEPLRPLTALACLIHVVATDESSNGEWRASLMGEFDRLVESTFARSDWYEHDQESDPVPVIENPAPRRLGITVHR